MSAPVLTIVHTESSKGWGGQEHRTFKEMVGLKKLGHRMVLICQPDAKFLARAQEAGIPTYTVKMRNGVDVCAVAKIRRILKQEKADIVNTHSGRDSILGGLAGRLAGCLVVRTRHLALPITSKFTYSVLPHHVVSVSEHVRRYLISEGIPSNSITTVYTGIDPAMFDDVASSTLKTELNLPDDALVVGTVAILRGKKGHRFIVDAAKNIVARYPNVHFVFAGDGPQTDNLQKQIAEASLASHIHMLGLRRDIANLLHSFDIFILPTEQEALGTAFIEAMSVGLPIVGTNVDGVPEVVKAGENGILVPPQSSAAIEQALETLIQSPEKRQEMGRKSLALVSSTFHVETMCQQMLALYQTLLKKSA